MTTSDIDNLVSQQNSKDTPNKTEVVVRHRGKLESAIHNAKMIQKLKAKGQSLQPSHPIYGHLSIINQY